MTKELLQDDRVIILVDKKNIATIDDNMKIIWCLYDDHMLIIW
jgi:hypothetical protein